MLRLRWIPFALLLLLPAARARADSACDAVTAHRKDTVIVFTPPSSFAICNDGSEETDVVVGRRVFLQLVPNAGTAMFRFRVHGQAAEPKVTGLRTMRKQTRALADTLGELSHSSERISALSVGAEGGPLGGSRTRYLGVVTSGFSDALAGSRTNLHDLSDATRVVDRWCRELRSAGDGNPELRDACGSTRAPGDVAREVTQFERSAATFDAARDLARESLVTSSAHPDDADAAANAAKLLDLARGTATTLVTEAGSLASTARSVADSLGELRTAIGALGALRPGAPSYLATYGEAGNAILRIDTIPIGIDVDDRSEDETNASFRFPVVGRHYFDVEVGAGVTGGLPDIPTVTTSGNAPIIDCKPVDEFLALALVELEPFRFGWPDKPLAGLLRFPVIGIPLSRDPTQNFFVGAGIGWTGIGSITAGPYLLRELTLNPGHDYGDALPAGSTLGSVTSPNVNVGFFVSASVDVVGLFRLFVHEHEPTLDAATGRER